MEKLYYLRNLKNNEIKKLETLCEKWNAISLQDVPEEECGRILSTIGQTKLLIKEKFEQFNNLLTLYENKNEKITIEDLEGFWDLVNIQIDDIVNKFNNLEMLQSNAWVSEDKLNINKPSTKKESKKIILSAEQREAAKRRLAEAKAKFKSRLISKDSTDNIFT